MAGRQVRLADRLTGRLDVPAEEPEITDADPAPGPEPVGERPLPRRRRPAPVAAPEPEPAPGLPKYLQMQRIEGRVTLAQSDALDMLAKRLNRARGRGVGERITANTLIRVAIDLLLARTDDLAGVDEGSLRQSLGLPDSQTPE